ncbi:MAG TPA: hypothetical protein VGR56_08630 [Nitrososphaerales archaeon]|nr:hypothetical protein [Nitrososphaerales archaeon]
MAEVGDVLASIKNRRKHNIYLAGKFGILFVAYAVVAEATSYYLPILGGLLFTLGFFGSVFGLLLLLNNLKPITIEEHVFQDLTKTLEALRSAKRTSDRDQVTIAAKALRKATRRAKPSIYTTPPTSSIVDEGEEILLKLLRILKLNIPEKSEQSPEKLQAVIDVVEKFVETLKEPTFTKAKVLADSYSLPPVKKPTRKVNLEKLMERRATQIMISVLAAVIVPPVLAYLYAELFGLDPMVFIRQNLPVLLAGAIAVFGAFLVSLARK